jgi:hypothetical protein
LLQSFATQRHVTEQLLSSVANSAPFYDAADSEHDSDEDDAAELAAQLPGSASQFYAQVRGIASRGMRGDVGSRGLGCRVSMQAAVGVG